MTFIKQSFIGTQPPSWEGETPRGNTWASLRAPVWEGAGFLPNPELEFAAPVSENWSDLSSYQVRHSAGYPKALTRLLKAYPVSVHLNSAESPSGSFLTAMGFSMKRVGDYDDELYLNLGTGYSYGGEVDGNGGVRNGIQHYAAGGMTGYIGYDWWTTQVSMIYCQVNITYNDWHGNEYTLDVSISGEMFPEDPANYLSEYGTYVATITIPSDGSGTTSPKAKINYVTIPD
jgi:hypothetical protein